MIKNKLLRKGFIIGIVYLVICTSLLTTVNAINSDIKPNENDDTNNLENSNLLLKNKCKIFIFGRISDLEIDDNYWSFRTNNVRMFSRWNFFGSRGCSFQHLRRVYLCFETPNFVFRGILRPHFICGVFHLTYRLCV